MLMYTLPKPRYDYYQDSDYEVIQANVLNEVDKLVGDLGMYPV
jgi:hypothetical protein